MVYCYWVFGSAYVLPSSLPRALVDWRIEPMTAEQAATLKRLAEAAYELDAFQPNLTSAEADVRIAMLTAKLKLLDGPPHTLWEVLVTSRRFPSPWSAELQPNYYVVRDANGQQIAYIYYSNDPERRAAAKLLPKDEARRIASNIAKLPDLLRKS
jgi:hypothetical protein